MNKEWSKTKKLHVLTAINKEIKFNEDMIDTSYICNIAETLELIPDNKMKYFKEIFPELYIYLEEALKTSKIRNNRGAIWEPFDYKSRYKCIKDVRKIVKNKFNNKN